MKEDSILSILLSFSDPFLASHRVNASRSITRPTIKPTGKYLFTFRPIHVSALLIYPLRDTPTRV